MIELFCFLVKFSLALDNDGGTEVDDHQRMFNDHQVEDTATRFQSSRVVREQSQHPACHEHRRRRGTIQRHEVIQLNVDFSNDFGDKGEKVDEPLIEAQLQVVNHIISREDVRAIEPHVAPNCEQEHRHDIVETLVVLELFVVQFLVLYYDGSQEVFELTQAFLALGLNI